MCSRGYSTCLSVVIFLCMLVCRDGYSCQSHFCDLSSTHIINNITDKLHMSGILKDV